MADRTRPIRKEICLNEQEMNLIHQKMAQLGTRNFGAYARKMLLDGYIIKVGYTEQKNWPLLSAMLPPISIRFAGVSIRPGDSMLLILPS